MHGISGEEYQRLEIRLMASNSFLQAKMLEYSSILLRGDPNEREQCRNEVLFSMEAMLDLQEQVTAANLFKAGIDPFTRHIGPNWWMFGED